MSVQITKLSSGLIIATDPMPHLQSAALGVWVNCGARHESPREMGLSHMLEHMAFKGTERRSAKDIAVEMEAVGADLNAYTSREQTAFHARALKEHVPLVLDMLSDILTRPTFEASELERERDVIIQEIGQARDTPDDLVFDYLQAAAYPEQPMGWSILGTEQTVGSFSRDDLKSYMAGNYRTGAAMLIASGAVNHADMVQFGENLFASLPSGSERKPEPAVFGPGDVRDEDDLEQAHVTFAFAGVPMSHRDAVAAQVYATALGGGMSSRLFQEAREKRGLCYSIYAFAHSYSDSGMIGIYAGTSEEKAGEIAPIVAGEMAALASEASEEETARARAQLRASLLMALESPHARCEQIATHLLAYGRVIPVAELIERIDAVDAAVLRRFASDLCERGQPAMAALGPVKKLETRDRFASRFGQSPPTAAL
jgi:predicted Zn-dependent peptidase